ncbi:MAG: heavy metal translocating P-type ATPase [Treponema sp.]|jgi:Cu2+-exporting ATPase|nr:heavy metal translocating P-type ATPase [Treponema sp.]
MRAVLVHSLPGRLRFRVKPGALNRYDTAGLAQELGAIRGVKQVSLNPRTGGILLYYDRAAGSEAQTRQGLADLDAAPYLLRRPAARREEPVWSYIAYQLVRALTPPALKPAVTVLGSLPFFAAALKSLARPRLDVPVLDAAAIGASLAQGNTKAASTLIMLLKTGEYLEAWAKQRSRKNLTAALSLKPASVWVRPEAGLDRELPFDLLRPGDRVILRTGALIPIDGEVLEGRALVNEAAMTGEPLGVEKVPGSSIHGGTVIEEGELLVRTLKKGADTRYERIIQLIEDSEGAKADTEIKANRAAGRAVPFTFAAAALTWLFSRNFRKTAAVLSVDYSCAIKLATPLAFLTGIREGLGNGVFFKGGAPMEKFAAVDTVVFDKTGTLTQASPALARIIPYDGFSETSALKIAACLEEHFPHPVAKAVVAEALARGVRHREEHSQVKYIAAHGVASAYQGKHTVIGSRHFIGEDEGVDLSLAGEDEKAAAQEGCSVLYLAQEKKLAALLLIKDPLRPEAPEVVAMLRSLGVKWIYLLSGDNQKTAERIIQELSLDGGRGELLPQDKTAMVAYLRERGRTVAFVGDGMNDSPAMSAADVGIAMKDGADLAREVADITLKESSLYPLVIARLMAQRVIGRIHANTRAAIVLNSFFILMGLLENPVSGGAGGSRSVWLHNLTTLALSLNAMRLFLPEAKQ